MPEYGQGGTVTPNDAASTIIAVYACVSLRAELIGSLDLCLYKRQSETQRKRIETDEGFQGLIGAGYPGTLAKLVGSLPNPEQTAQEFWETVSGHLDLWGNFYGEVVRDGSGRPKAIWPFRPDKMRVKRVEGKLVYIYTLPNGREQPFPRDAIMHIRGPLSSDGITGLSPISVAKTSLTGLRAAERFASSWYGNSAQPSAVVTVPKTPGGQSFDDRAKGYASRLRELYSGYTNAGRLAVFEEGVTWQSIQMPMTDMQFVETRKFQLQEIARLYRIPPHMIGDTDRSTSWGTGIEQMTIGFLNFTLRPIMERIEAAIDRDLGLVPGVKTLGDESIYAEFDASDILRTDISTRYTAYGAGIQWGFLTRADVRAWENLDPIEGLEVPIYPANMLELGAEPPASDGANIGQGLMSVASAMSIEKPPARTVINNNPPADGGRSSEVVAGIDALRTELRAVELFGRVKDDLEAIHTLRDESLAAQEETRQLAEALSEDTARALDKAKRASDEFQTETRSNQMELFSKLEDLKPKPTVHRAKRDKLGRIAEIETLVDGEVVDSREVVRDSNGKVEAL